jgi:acyl-CoA reductase-like NAD-dependent aldehyde dehydrogenase
VFDEFVDRLVTETKRLRLGDPLDPATDVGPMVAEAQRGRVEDQLDGAVRAGGDHQRGWFLAPTVVVDVDDSMDLLTTETFGPVAPVQRVGSLEEAIARANALPYGLGANVYTQRLEYVLRCMDELQAGTVWFNDPLTDNDAGPFGGMKMSGNARELGPEGLEAFRETKHVTWTVGSTASHGGIRTGNRVSLGGRVKQMAGPADGGGVTTSRSAEVGR